MNVTKIEWTDFSANPLKFKAAAGATKWACVKVSPGCAHCYSETLAHRYGRGGLFNAGETAKLTPYLDEAELRKMLTANVIGGKPVAGSRCFVGDMTDLFGAWVTDALLDRLFAVFALRPDVTWQVLTKRPERARAYLIERAKSASAWKTAARSMGYALEFNGISLVSFPVPNLWLGTSVENQKTADERIPLLLQTPAGGRFVSAEPLLEALDLSGPLNGYPRQTSSRAYVSREMAMDAGDRDLEGALYSDDEWEQTYPPPDWVIIGGESGPGARPCSISWVRSIVDQCKAARVPVFVKQLGAMVADGEPGVNGGHRPKDGKGGDPSEWSEDLRVRQFPKGHA